MTQSNVFQKMVKENNWKAATINRRKSMRTSSTIAKLVGSLSLLQLAFVLTPAALFAQTDDVLLQIPTDQYARACRSVTTGLRAYQRFPDFLLVGCDHRALAQMGKRGLNVSILDDNPWSDSYAVVSTHPGNKHQRTYAGVNCRILYSSPDFDLIKADSRVLHQLRNAGYVCIEIERMEIPVETYSTHLPSLSYDRPNDFISETIANVSDSTVRECIQRLQDFGTRYWNNASRDTVARWIRGKYAEYGVTDAVLDSFQYSGTWQKNVVATISGTVTPTAELIVGGHHDSYSSNLSQAPGADDNASGTVAAMEMARVLKLVNYQPALTMRFMGYSAEEAGLIGSASYAQRARSLNRDIRVMQNYDMIANRYQAPTDNSVYIVWYTTSEAYRDLHAAMMRTYTPLIPVATTSYRSGSDSYSFWQQNYRSVFCIEKNFSPYYHSSNDLLQYLDVGFAANVIRSGLAMLLTLDQMPATVAGLTVRDCGDGVSLYASWDSVAVPDWYRYKVYVGTSPGVYTSNSFSTTRWTTLPGLTAGTRYYIGVSIVDLAGQEGMITELSEVPRAVPQAPTGILVERYLLGAKVTWRENSEMDLRGYNVYRSIDSMTTFQRLNTELASDTSWIDTVGTAMPRVYYLTAVDSVGNESAHSDTVLLAVVSVKEPDARIPIAFRLEQNYPNPFNPTTNIAFEVGNPGYVSLRVYDILGREVTSLVNEAKLAGRYSVVWNASGVASGVYFCRLEAEGRVETRRMVLMR